MKTTLTGTLVGTLLLAGSTTAALAVAPSQDTLSGKNTPTSSTAPTPQAQNTQSQNTQSQTQAQQNQAQPDQGQPIQNKPNTTENSWTQDLASRQPGQSGSSMSGSAMAQDQSSQRRNASAGTTGNRAMHHHAVRSAEKTDEMGDRMTEALNLLSADGYFNIQSLTPQGDQFLANATQNGRNVSVLVDPQSGKVTNRS
jgi:hypothetical protein